MNTSQRGSQRDEVAVNIRDFLVGAESLPSPKGSALQLMAIARDPNSSIDEAVRVVKSDPALAGFVLRAANSARYGVQGKAMDLQRAVIRLGMNLIRVHAITLSMIGQRSKSRCAEFNYDGFWASTLLAAITARQIARVCDDIPAEEAFSLGLLGNIGKLAFATAAPDDYGRALRSASTGDTSIEDEERRIFGFDHHELSAVLLVEWGLPVSMGDIVYWQRDPEAGGFAPDSRAYRLACALQLAGEMTQQSFLPSEGPSPGTSLEYLRAGTLELSTEDVEEISRAAISELSDWLAMTGVRVPSPPHALGAGSG